MEASEQDENTYRAGHVVQRGDVATYKFTWIKHRSNMVAGHLGWWDRQFNGNSRRPGTPT